ncbi:MAG: hypothetical protein AVDCRST_MAG74-795 [uncultured Pyrinomonadaceae bacterium]|uniref:Beta-hexosaminidase bacterial type N-terminal domain-containing protein n=1 Tax=uncultured Pyrinomonadaceae bacterium TaxID=2283094 RepID=A0A6J4NH68_9BACT|nr:MAG: hypothetical protein AVDCRST_MAG74-795 [uncultured Pyrinomonadaceae bacterium]
MRLPNFVWVFEMLCLLGIFSGIIFAEKLTLAENGASDYVILVSPQASEVERYAAAELQKYLGQITGSRLSIETRANGKPFIVVGNHPLARKIRVASRYAGDDAFRQKTAGANLFLKGATERGTLYAVYNFLEAQGCRWFTPAIPQLAGHHEFVPKRATLAINATDSFKRPLMKYRKRDGDIGRRSNTAATWTPILEWAAKMRANSFSLSLRAYEEHRELLKTETEKRGMILQVGQHDVMNEFLAPQKYFAAHPEWFGLIDGKRTLRARGKQVIFETANAKAMKTFENNLIAYLESRPEIDVFQLWLADAGLWSESAEAQKMGAPAERMAIFIQQITKALRSAKLKTKISFIAYSFYTEPPRNMNFEPQTILEFCPINQNHSFSLDDAAAPENRKYYEQLQKWIKRFPGEVTHYSYYAKFSWRSLPVVLPLQIAREIKNWHRIGEVGTSIYSEPGNWLALEFNHAAFSRASWEENFDAEKWYDEYLQARFGAAAQAMKRYHALATRISLEALIPQSADKNDTRDFQDLLAQTQAAMHEAMEKADTPDAKWLVGKLAWQPEYLALALRFRDAQRAEDKEQMNQLRGAIARLIAARANDGTTLDRGYGYQLMQEDAPQ